MDGNALSADASRNFLEEIAGRIVKIQLERAGMGIAVIAKDKRFGQVDRSQEMSAYIVRPYSVSQLESPVLRLLPDAEADAASPWIDVWVVNFGPPRIPDLERFLDRLISNPEADMPESNDGRVRRLITLGGRLVRDRQL